MQAKFTYRIKIDPKVVARPAQQAFVVYTRLLYNQFTEEFADQKWNWPRLTQRKNGSIAGRVRDIVDTGELMGSQQLAYTGKTTAIYSWNTPYAKLVLTGFRTSRGREYRGRNWVDSGIAALPPTQYIAGYLKSGWVSSKLSQPTFTESA